jgi:ABC-2 type transport system permease protein
MMTLLVRNEWRATVRDGRLVVFAAALLLLVVGATIAAGAGERARATERALVERITREQWNDQGVKHPHRGAHFGLYALRPSSPLSIIDPGVTDEVGQTIWLEPHRRNMARDNPAADAPPDARLGQAVPAFVLIVLIPLLLIVSAHHAVTQEREWGTLRMMYGLGLSGTRLLCAKWFGLLSIAGLLLLPTVLVAGITLAGHGSTPSEARADLASRLLVMMGVLTLYYGTISALTVVLSSRFQTSRAAWLGGLGLWVTMVLMVPRIGSAVADRAIALPTGEEFWAAIAADIQRGLPGDGDAATRLKAFDDGLLREHGVARVEELPFGITARRRLFRDAYAARVHAVHFADLWSRYSAQERIVQFTGLLTPTLPARHLLMAIAGTDLQHQRRFEEAAERYRDEFTAAIDEWDARSTRGMVSYETRYAGNSVWSAIAPFVHRSATLSYTLRSALPELAMLVVWSAAALLLLRRSGRRLAP